MWWDGGNDSLVSGTSLTRVLCVILVIYRWASIQLRVPTLMEDTRWSTERMILMCTLGLRGKEVHHAGRNVSAVGFSSLQETCRSCYTTQNVHNAVHRMWLVSWDAHMVHHHSMHLVLFLFLPHHSDLLVITVFYLLNDCITPLTFYPFTVTVNVVKRPQDHSLFISLLSVAPSWPSSFFLSSEVKKTKTQLVMLLRNPKV